MGVQLKSYILQFRDKETISGTGICKVWGAKVGMDSIAEQESRRLGIDGNWATKQRKKEWDTILKTYGPRALLYCSFVCEFFVVFHSLIQSLVPYGVPSLLFKTSLFLNKCG